MELQEDLFDDVEVKFIYRATITLRNGKKLIAANYGKKAFKIPIRHYKRREKPII